MNKKNNLKTLAVSQIISLVLEIFAFTFIFGMSLGNVSAEIRTETTPDGYRILQDTSSGIYKVYGLDGGIVSSGTELDLSKIKANLLKTSAPASNTLSPDSPSDIPNQNLENTNQEAFMNGDTSPSPAPVGSGRVPPTTTPSKSITSFDYGGKTYESANGADLGPNFKMESDSQLADMIKVGTIKEKLPVNPNAYSAFGISISSAYPILGNIGEGVYWASISWGLVQLLGQMGIIDQDMSKALGAALAGGIVAGKAAYGAFSEWGTKGGDWGASGSYAQWSSAGIGILVAYLIFASQYKDTKTHEETMEFKCLSWQAPVVMDKNERAKDCNKCNGDPLKPCSEYRCKALGQSCKIINEGTALMKCIDGAIDDVNSPGIKPFKEVLTAGYSYEPVKNRPAGKASGVSGMGIKYNGGCLKAWTPFDFGIITYDKLGQNQPAQCKMDFNHTTSFDAMNYWMGGSNLFIENHSQRVSLPGTAALNSEFPEIQNDGAYKIYIRCRNGNGNANDDEFVVDFCVDKTPDLTPPVIAAATPANGAPVLYKIDNVTTNIYTNEPAECKWSRKESSDYSNMENSFICANDILNMNAESLYTCTTTLTGIQDKVENKFYFRCRDLSPQNNTMSDNYEYSLWGTQPLTIISTGPSGVIGSATSTGSVNLEVKTDYGYTKGEAICSYSPTKTESSYIPMFDTGAKNTHSQSLDLVGGTYKYYLKCTDLGGNTAYNQTSFVVYIDKYAPEVARVYNLESKIKLITNEDAICKYSTTSCSFDINAEGISTSMPFDWTREHWAEWKTDQTYYIKCMDKFNNQPNPDACSIIVRPYELSKKE